MIEVRLRELSSTTNMDLTDDVAGHYTRLTRTVSTGQNTDHVGDGIPDWWRTQYFGGNGQSTNNLSCATCDSDGDGLNNLAEYVSWTDPTNSISGLRIVNIARQPDGSCQITWTSAPAVNYQLWATTDLSLPFALISGTIPSAGATTTSTEASAGVIKYYKVRVLP